MQLGDIDTLAVEAEPPTERRKQEADDDNAPAIVSDRAFRNSLVGGCVHLFFSAITCSALDRTVHPFPVPTIWIVRPRLKDLPGRIPRQSIRRASNCQHLVANAA